MSAAGGVELVHVDDSLIVAVKPAGLLAVPGRHVLDCLAARVQALHADARVVHRLDMATSGLMLLARGAAMQSCLSQAFAERRVDKGYVALVRGRIEPSSGEIDLPLGADWPNRPKQRVDTVRGKASLTRYRSVAHDVRTNVTRVALEPVTGRSHQLRVHLLAIGHPVVGDTLYAPDEVGTAERLMLHAERLGFVHPQTGESMRFRSPAPFVEDEPEAATVEALAICRPART